MKDYEERFWAKVDKRGTSENPYCWVWTACRNRNGYGQFRLNGGMRYAHRVAYETLIDSIPSGFELDHLCRNPACVNPCHLEVVTHTENVSRGEIGVNTGKKQASKTHCPRGHLYDEKNTYYRPTQSGGQGRNCRACASIFQKTPKALLRGRELKRKWRSTPEGRQKNIEAARAWRAKKKRSSQTP